MEKIRVTVWNEFLHELNDEKLPLFIRREFMNVLLDFLKKPVCKPKQQPCVWKNTA